MASDNSKAHNNANFQLSEVFGVKGKVALITGKIYTLTKMQTSFSSPK
jgi:hypothetical protein